MANRFANGAKSFGFCDVCSFRFPLKKLKNLVVKTKQTQIRACPACWTPDQPQLQLGMYPVADPQAIRDPRPDTNTWYASGNTGLQVDPTQGTGLLQDGFPGEGSRVIQWGWAPVGGSQSFDDALTPNDLVGRGEVGTVTTTTTAPPGGVYINYALIPLALLEAGVSIQPAKALFRDTLIGSRPLGDINDSGTVSPADSQAYNRWIGNITQTASNVTYIQTVLNPYMITNSSTYAAYLIFT